MLTLWPAARLPESQTSLLRLVLVSVLIANNALLALFVGVVVWHVVAYYPVNHWGFDARRGLVFCLVNLAAGMVGGRWNWRMLTLLVATLVVGASLLLVDHCNILVEYNRWTARHMPGFGE